MSNLLKLLNGSKEYQMEGSILTIRSYRTGEEIKLDLSVLAYNEEILEEMIIKEEE